MIRFLTLSACLGLILSATAATAQLASDPVTHQWSSVEFFPLSTDGCRISVGTVFVQGGQMYANIRNMNPRTTFRVVVSAGVYGASGQAVAGSWLGILGPNEGGPVRMLRPFSGSLAGSRVVMRVQTCTAR